MVLKAITTLGAALCFSLALSTLTPALAAKIKIIEKTNYYTITGRNASDFARSMSKKGPYSFQHRRRAWATATRDLSFSLNRAKSRSGCRVKSVNVTLKITYKLPRLGNLSKVSSRERKKWRRMLSLLTKHERVHGKFYKELAYKTERSLKRLKPAKSCRALRRKALKLATRLSDEDSARNDRFDRRDLKNYRRMARIYGS